MKPLRFTNHVLTTMAERNLDRSWIERTIRAPDWREPDPADPAVERRFAVAAEIRILTAFLDRRARRPE